MLYDGRAAARAARLSYATAPVSGASRRRVGRGFVYYDAKGRRITRPSELERIARLAIPPAWKNVWISASPQSHLQATGTDAKGRKQYKYHPRFRAVREAAKYAHIRLFAERLPGLRQRVRRELRRAGLDRDKVLSALVELMQRTCMRVGNDCYAATNRSYGVTTLRDRHATIRGSALRLQFKGKAGKLHEISLDDARLARIVRRCRDLPGQRLFQYQDQDGQPHAVTSGDVNEYLRRVTGEPFSAKDFRTWSGTLLALHQLDGSAAPGSEREARRAVRQALEQVSAELGNTVSVCRKSYVHPLVIDQYTRGELAASLRRARRAARRAPLRGLREIE
ncbi:MAG TPA: DNA topoisomerase IB, partial [Polyangiaceae bacterium]|nr:DNA topoisomerase IB [Polyangiaceae bacterium]